MWESGIKRNPPIFLQFVRKHFIDNRSKKNIRAATFSFVKFKRNWCLMSATHQKLPIQSGNIRKKNYFFYQKNRGALAGGWWEIWCSQHTFSIVGKDTRKWGEDKNLFMALFPCKRFYSEAIQRTSKWFNEEKKIKKKQKKNPNAMRIFRLPNR